MIKYTMAQLTGIEGMDPYDMSREVLRLYRLAGAPYGDDAKGLSKWVTELMQANFKRLETLTTRNLVD